ncbi:MAG: Hsp20/alpha crystallin family protein [Vicinamibacterales bacterium]|nr:Hsp20/alpha crystallin family protein [Vicinamibacterales bacterium]
MAVSRWDPLHDLLALHERMNRLGPDDPPGWTPAVDLYETADRFVLSIELPGLTRDQIKIELQQDILTVRGDRAVQHEEGAEFHRVERGHGPFARSFSLPNPADADRVQAEFRDGVLTVAIPKLAPPTRRITVD